MSCEIKINVRDTYWDTVGILLSDALCFRFALLERVLVLELRTHFGRWFREAEDGMCISVRSKLYCFDD